MFKSHLDELDFDNSDLTGVINKWQTKMFWSLSREANRNDRTTR